MPQFAPEQERLQAHFPYANTNELFPWDMRSPLTQHLPVFPVEEADGGYVALRRVLPEVGLERLAQHLRRYV